MHWHFVLSTQVMLKFADYTPKRDDKHTLSLHIVVPQGYLISWIVRLLQKLLLNKMNCCNCKWVTCAKPHACNVLGSSILRREYKIVIFHWADPRIIWKFQFGLYDPTHLSAVCSHQEVRWLRRIPRFPWLTPNQTHPALQLSSSHSSFHNEGFQEWRSNRF